MRIFPVLFRILKAKYLTLWSISGPKASYKKNFKLAFMYKALVVVTYVLLSSRDYKLSSTKTEMSFNLKL